MHIIKASLSDLQVVDGNKAVPFLHISGQRNHLGRKLRERDKASQYDPSDLIQKFLAEIGYSFIEDLIPEINEVLVVDTTILEAFNIFNMEIKSTTFTRVIQLKLRPLYQRLNKKLNFRISFALK